MSRARHFRSEKLRNRILNRLVKMPKCVLKILKRPKIGPNFDEIGLNYSKNEKFS